MPDPEPAGASRWAVVGGGMLGLTLALRLAQQGKEVVVFEAADEVGGLASAWTLDAGGAPVTWDRHYHVTLGSDAALRGLLAELGLERELRWVGTRTGYYADGVLSPASDTIEFLRLPALTLLDKARIGLTMLVASRRRDWRRLERIRVGDWLRAWSGAHAFDRFWRPLLIAKLGDGYHDASAAFIWATVQRLDSARSGGRRNEQFGYLPGGYARILATLGGALEAAGATVRTGSRVEAVAPRGGRVEVSRRGHPPECFDQVVVTAPTDVAADLCPALSGREQARLRDVRYQGIVCASVVLRRPLSPYYLTYITDPAPFTAVVEMTALVDPAELGGHALVYLPQYVAPDDALLDASDRVIEERFLGGLEAMYPAFARADVLAFRVSRARRVFAVPTLGFSRGVPPMPTSIRGVHIVTSAQIVNGTLNVDQAIRLAESAARRFSPDSSEPTELP